MVAGLDLGDPLITFLIILILAVVLPEILHSIRITPVPFYISAGILIGPHVAGLETHESLAFMADIGLYLLIFLAGLEVFETRHKGFKQSIVFTLITGTVTALCGFALGMSIGWGWEASTLLGLVMMSSSVGECIPLINSHNFLKRHFGHILIPGVIILDGVALLGVGFLVSRRADGGWSSTFIYFIGIIILIAFAVFILPRALRMYFKRKRHMKDADFKMILMVLVLVVLMSGLAGIHGIVPAFIVGIVMGEFVTTQSLYDKLHGIGHGIFIPLFFVIIGMQLDIGVVMRGEFNFLLPLSFVAVLFSSKVAGGLVYAAATGRTMREGLLLGITFWPVLSATIAATVIGLKSGIFGQEALIAVVIMTVVSTLLTPFVLKMAAGKRITSFRLRDHVVIVGYGRTSSSLVSALEQTDQEFVVIDNKVGKVDRLERRKVNAVYGNATDPHVLSAASIESARIALITVTDGGDAYACAKLIREVNKGCFILVQVHTDPERATICKENLADFVLWPEKLSARIAMDVVVGSGLASRGGTGPRIDTASPPGGSALSAGNGKACHGKDLPDLPDAP